MISFFFFWISVKLTKFVIWILTDPKGLEFIAFFMLFANLIIFSTLSRFYDDSENELDHSRE